MAETEGLLTAEEAEMLDFERRWWRYAGHKEQAIKDTFDLSANIYYLRLNALINKPEALQRDPQLVWRLRALREHRQSLRSRR